MNLQKKSRMLFLLMGVWTAILFVLFVYLNRAEGVLPSIPDSMIGLNVLSGLFVVGISFAVLLFSLVLFAGKPSETYLFWLALLSYTTMVRTLMNSLPVLSEIPVLNLLFLGRFAYFGKDLARVNLNFHRLIMCVLVAYLRYRLMKCLFDVRIGRKNFFFYICLAAFVPVCLLGTDVPFYLGLMLVYTVCYFCEAHTILKSASSHFSTAAILAVAWAMTVSLRFFDAGCELAFLPQGFLNLQLRLLGIIESFYGLAFFLLACIRFTQKFIEAERLNTYLEEQVQKKTKEKTEFVRSLLHNLKTPLFSLGGYVDMAQAYLYTDPRKAFDSLEKLNRNTEYVQELMERIFLVSQLDEGKITFQKVPFDFQKLLEAVAESTRLKAAGKPVEVTLLASAPMPCQADPVYYQQALQNIADNAVEQMPEGGQIRITAENEAVRYRIGIFDDGVGIAPENLQRIFERYYSEHHGRRNSSGLGLAISKELIERQGGHIHVESQERKGTVFWIEVPKENNS